MTMEPTFQRLERSEQGFFTMWVLYLCLLVFFFGAVALEAWRYADEKRQLAAIVDGAAVAGATHIDVDYFKSAKSGTGADPEDDVILNRNAAEAAAEQYLEDARREAKLEWRHPPKVKVQSNDKIIKVKVQQEYELAMLGFLDTREEIFDVVAQSEARPKAVIKR